MTTTGPMTNMLTLRWVLLRVRDSGIASMTESHDLGFFTYLAVTTVTPTSLSSSLLLIAGFRRRRGRYT